MKNKNQIVPKKLSLIEMGKLYSLLRPYLNDDYLEIARQMIYTERDDFYSAINTLCKLTNPDYDKQDFTKLLLIFKYGLLLNRFQVYSSLVLEMSSGSTKQ